ncbi:hypothetical protein ACIQU6_40995 [Streptomyces sp. NPDC090442]|uniref:hypothetical protein n=1 Tax=Streptomyces sp. NPDC090442 TaxID=3365962 RepID=UPI0038291B1E
MPLNIAYIDAASFRARCEISAARTAQRDEDAYEAGAVVPSGAWRSLSRADVEPITAPRFASGSTLVEIVRPPSHEGIPLENLAHSMGDADAVFLGQALAEPGMVTTTNNYQDGKLIGLHLDNWDKLRFADRHTGRRRLCLNLGPGTRYIILGTVDAQAVCRTVHPTAYAHRYPHTEDCREYVASGRTFHIVRIRLAPGEGYIAPTEYLIHDGSTHGDRLPSTAAFWLGHWPRGILPSLV